jgi:hypothetical protein
VHFTGFLIGLMALLLIGIFHPVVIWTEYYFSKRVWPVFLAAGLIFLGVSAIVAPLLGSAALGILGFSCLWSIKELFDQEKRVSRGWFPSNPRRR